MSETFYKIDSPLISLDELIKNSGGDLSKFLTQAEVRNILKQADKPYLHWLDLKYKPWISAKLFPSKEFFWNLVRINRFYNSQVTPIQDVNHQFFRMVVNNYNEFLHTIDKEMAGNFMGVSGLSESDKRQFITRNIIEESIASSQLEGANTSRAVAKKMILEGRKAHNSSEQMILNNHNTMLKIEQELYKENLSWELICELHVMITEKTIEKNKQGVLRDTLDENGNRLVIKPWDDKTITYVAPDKKFVEVELSKLLDFANDVKNNDNNFIHPLIKAIMLHFWIGLLHPFEDGNGRLARILFYWYMFRHEYWAFAYLSLSEKIKKSPIQYAMAYIYSEQDGCDLTYFIDYNIEKLKLAKNDFQRYIKTKLTENQSIISLAQQQYDFNERQVKLLQYFNQKMENRTNIKAHQQLYSVKKGTAISDLKELVKKGFLIKKRHHKNIYYYPTEKVNSIFKFK